MLARVSSTDGFRCATLLSDQEQSDDLTPVVDNA